MNLKPTWLVEENDTVILIDDHPIITKGTKGIVEYIYEAKKECIVVFKNDDSGLDAAYTFTNKQICKDILPITFIYTNYRGETSVRTVIVLGTYYGTTPYHPEPGIILKAFDLEKNEKREFALKDCNFTKQG